MNTKPCMSSHNKKDNNINLYPILDHRERIAQIPRDTKTKQISWPNGRQRGLSAQCINRTLIL